jgi:hypothetical protein
MIVGPTQFSLPATDVQQSAKPVRASQPQPSAAAQIKVAPKLEKPASSAPIAEDVVKLQWDPSVHLRIYQFVNQSGALILQVPSEQQLNVTRGIQESLQKESLQRESLQEEAAQRSAPLSGIEGEKSNGG